MDLKTADHRMQGPILSVAPFPNSPPPGFVSNTYDHVWQIGRSRTAVWDWLCDPATFVDGQIPPFRVEFLQNAAGQTGFSEGVFNAHVGPFMSFSGVLGQIEPERYRDLQYFYGSYALSHALFRPTRLQFWLDDGPDPDTTVLRLQVDAYVRRSAVRFWSRAMGLFWKRFGSWCERAIPNHWLR
jgi:hypothetical protein